MKVRIYHQYNYKRSEVMDFVKLVESVLKVLTDYLQYFYPGFIFLWIFQFIRGKNFKENDISIIKSIIISYLLICVSKLPLIERINQDFFLVTISIVLPYIIVLISEKEWVKIALDFIGVKTSIHDNIIDLVKGMVKNEDDRNKLALKVYMDEIGIMYYGWLRIHESDNENNNIIALSSYIRYKKAQDGQYVENMATLPNNSKNKEWVIIDGKDITRIEIATELKTK